MDIVIVEPEIPGNLGAIARAMKNFAFMRLVVVNPGFEIDCEEVRNRAKHANDIIDNIKKVNSIKDLEYDTKIGTTGKLSSDYNLKRTPVTPEVLSQMIKAIDNSKVAIFFGRESHGMTNDELDEMDFLVHIPTDEEYGIMNLSHSVAIILYELHKSIGKENLEKRYSPIGDKEKHKITSMIGDIIDEYDFATDSKVRIQKELWKKIISKSMLSNREAFALMGFFRRIIKGERKQNQEREDSKKDRKDKKG